MLLKLSIIIPQQLNNVYFQVTFCEGLHLKLKMAILGMPKGLTITKVANNGKLITIMKKWGTHSCHEGQFKLQPRDAYIDGRDVLQAN